MEEAWRSFCRESVPDDWSGLPPSSREFLLELGLPSEHPWCSDPAGWSHPSSPPMGSPYDIDLDVSHTLALFWHVYILPFFALVDLWVRFLSGWVAPIGVCLGLLRNRHPQFGFLYRLLRVIIMVASWIWATDDQFILPYGRRVGLCLILANTWLWWRPMEVNHTSNPTRGNTDYLGQILGMQSRTGTIIRLLCLVCLLAWKYPVSLDDPDELATVAPGLYYHKKEDSHSHQPEYFLRTAKTFERDLPDYDTELATRWQPTGDARTGVPYLMNRPSSPIPTFHRVWLSTLDDAEEFLALDVAFPVEGHDSSKPIYLVFHGINGGSAEGYVVDLASSRTQKGSTVVVLIARGMMNTPLKGWTFFHGARTSDAHAAAKALREQVVRPGQTLAGVGYSLGAIVLNNYVATYGTRAELDVSVSISGALACSIQTEFIRSRSTWQHLIAAHLKQETLLARWGRRLLHRLGPEQYHSLVRAKTVVDIDTYAGVRYNGFKDQNEYYAAMSAVEPFYSEKKIAIPHLILHAFDDPISTWRTNASNDPASPLYPTNLVRIQERLVILLTRTGGHVGWPVGWWPRSWSYMNDFVAAGFVDSYDRSKGS